MPIHLRVTIYSILAYQYNYNKSLDALLPKPAGAGYGTITDRAAGSSPPIAAALFILTMDELPFIFCTSYPNNLALLDQIYPPNCGTGYTAGSYPVFRWILSYIQTRSGWGENTSACSLIPVSPAF